MGKSRGQALGLKMLSLVFCLWVDFFSLAGVVVQPLRRFFLVSLAPLFAFTASILLVLQPLADRHGGLFKSAETIIEADQQPCRNGNRESHLRYQLGPVHV
jgi:hypothetical protein